MNLARSVELDVCSHCGAIAGAGTHGHSDAPGWRWERVEYVPTARTIDVDALHRAADRVGSEAGTPGMDELADAVADFIQASFMTDELGVPFTVDGPSFGYGILLGYLAAKDG